MNFKRSLALCFLVSNLSAHAADDQSKQPPIPMQLLDRSAGRIDCLTVFKPEVLPGRGLTYDERMNFSDKVKLRILEEFPQMFSEALAAGLIVENSLRTMHFSTAVLGTSVDGSELNVVLATVLNDPNQLTPAIKGAYAQFSLKIDDVLFFNLGDSPIKILDAFDKPSPRKEDGKNYVEVPRLGYLSTLLADPELFSPAAKSFFIHLDSGEAIKVTREVNYADGSSRRPRDKFFFERFFNSPAFVVEEIREKIRKQIEL